MSQEHQKNSFILLSRRFCSLLGLSQAEKNVKFANLWVDFLLKFPYLKLTVLKIFEFSCEKLCLQALEYILFFSI